MQPKKNSFQQKLKKIEVQTLQQQKQKISQLQKDIPIKQSSQISYQQKHYWTKFKDHCDKRVHQFVRRNLTRQNKHIFLISIFFVAATFISWKLEKKYDNMRDKAFVTKSHKQLLVQRENQYIQKMLTKNQFESVPIPQQIEQKYIYRFQNDNQVVVFDSKDQMLEAMANDIKNGQSVLPEYEQQLKRKDMI